MTTDILSTIEDGIGFITLNRPQLRNAISKEMWCQLPRIMAEARAHGARVIVLAGEGDSFASGADLDELEQIDNENSARDLWLAIKGCLDYVFCFELPTIAMIHGTCLGGGCLLALMCDMRFASLASSFAIPVARLGLLLDNASIARIVSLIGPSSAKEMLFTGNAITSKQAESLGLINRAVTLDLLRLAVLDVAHQIVSNALTTIVESKRACNQAILALSNPDLDEKVVQSYLSTDFKTRISQRS